MNDHKIVRFLHEIMRTDVFLLDSEEKIVEKAVSVNPPDFLLPLLPGLLHDLWMTAVELPQTAFAHYESPSLHLSFLVMNVQQNGQIHAVLCAGPFTSEPITRRHTFELLGRLNLPQNSVGELFQYLQSVPFPLSKLPAMGQLMMNTCYSPFVQAEMAAPKELPVMDTSRLVNPLSARQALDNTAFQYNLEFKMREAIRTGNTALALQSFHDMPTDFSYRLPDNPLRLRKNMTFVLSTIARIAAADGGVSPQVIHKMSEHYFHLIEYATSPKELRDLQSRIITDYCREVQKVQTANYSPNICRIIDYLHLNFSYDFSLDELADALSLNKNYLCRLFRRETGQTIMEYLTDLRIRHAKYLLRNTELPVTDICFLSGFSSYISFSRVFKSTTGTSCSQWRSSVSAK